MDLVQASQTAYDVPVVIAVNTSVRMKPFEKEIFSCLVEILMCIKDMKYNYGRHINAKVKLIAFNDCIVTDEIKNIEHTEAFLLFMKLGDFHGVAKAETLFTCLNNIFVPDLYKENRVLCGNVPVVFITDGFFEDDVKVALQRVNGNTGFRYATKIGIFVGDPNASLGELITLTGNSGTCIRSSEENSFRKLISNAFYDYRFDEWTNDDIEEYLSDLKEWIKQDLVNSCNNENLSRQSDDTAEQDNGRKTFAPSFKVGEIIKTENNTFKICSKLDTNTYVVEDATGSKKALRHIVYSVNWHGEDLYKKIRLQTTCYPLKGVFIWPEDITTEDSDMGFGYIVPLISGEFKPLMDLLVASTGFPSYKIIIEVCINLFKSFRILHQLGWAYGEISPNSIFCNAKTGEICIMGGVDAGPAATTQISEYQPRFVAPELVYKESKVDCNTDLYSEVVVAFFLLMGGHPFEGEHWVVPCLTPDIEKKLYGLDAVFVFDPEDDSNRPVKGVHDIVVKR